jgi:hypothetical protein
MSDLPLDGGPLALGPRGSSPVPAPLDSWLTLTIKALLYSASLTLYLIPLSSAARISRRGTSRASS